MYLSFISEIFDKFPIIRELELPLNAVPSISLSHTMFKHLEVSLSVINLYSIVKSLCDIQYGFAVSLLFIICV